MTPQQMLDTMDAAPGGVDLAELCTRPSPTGRTCLQQVARGHLIRACDECQDLQGQLLEHVGLER